MLVPLRGHEAGTHQLTIALHPADLGPVSVVAHLDHHGSISVELTSASDAAHDAMATALPALHRNLHDAGFGSVTVSMGTATGGGSMDSASNGSDPRAAVHAAAVRPVRSGRSTDTASAEPVAGRQRPPHSGPRYRA